MHNAACRLLPQGDSCLGAEPPGDPAKSGGQGLQLGLGLAAQLALADSGAVKKMNPATMVSACLLYTTRGEPACSMTPCP